MYNNALTLNPLMNIYCPGFTLLLTLLPVLSSLAQLPDEFSQQRLATGLNPVTMAFAPDGRLFLAEKDGRVLIVENDQLLPQPLLSIEVDNFNERGLSGLAVHPDFEDNGYLYVFYTVKDSNYNRVSRFTIQSNFAQPGSEEIILETEPLSGTIHNGGAMKFGPDGKLYIATGDGAFPQNANSLSSLLGKILRLNDDGSIPEDNPYQELEDTYRAIWASGFRNPFTFDIHPLSGQVLVNDVGSNLFEEISSAEAGMYYGWPDLEGFNTGRQMPDNYRDPLYAYGREQGCSIVGAAFYRPDVLQFPQYYHDKYFFADYCEGYIKLLDPANPAAPEVFITGIDRPVDIEVAPDGTLYYLERAGMGGGSQQDNTASSNGALWKVSYTGSGAPTVSVQPEDLLVSVGDTARLSIEASGTGNLAYQWQRDGTDLSEADSSVLIFPDVAFADSLSTFRCIVSNAEGSDTSRAAVLSVTRQQRPEPEIMLSLRRENFHAGDTVFFSGRATDAEEGLLTADRLSWKIDLHHDAHTHPALENVRGIEEGTYVIPRTGKPEHNIWFRIYLTATDALGLSKTVYRELYPQKTEVSLQSNVEGLQVNVDGSFHELPYTFTSVVGVRRFIEAPLSQVAGDDGYVFTDWQDGATKEEDKLLSFEVPEAGAAWQVNYEVIPKGDGEGLLGIYRQENGPDSTAVMFSRKDAEINFDWVFDSPRSDMRGDGFTVEWKGEVMPYFSEEYTFYTSTDDGARLWVNGKQIIDRWVPQAETEWAGSISLEAGKRYPIRMMYYEDGGHAVARLRWSSARTPKQIIPASQLFSDRLITSSTDEMARGEWRIYPNPVDELLKVRLPSSSAPLKLLRISNLQGKVIYTRQLDKRDQYALEVSTVHMPPGAYLLQLVGEAGSFSKLLFKK